MINAIIDTEKYFSVDGNYDLITFTDNLKFDSVLDIGFGGGGTSLYFATKGKKVTSIGLNVHTYDYPRDLFDEYKIQVFDSDFLNFNSEKKFDALLMSHVLEHTLNPGLFLEKARNMLNDEGWLFVMVPPYNNYVLGGHVTPGWNIGHLMYVLMVSGFDIKNGHFIRYGYNICAFVQKNKTPLPKLRMDYGDLGNTAHLWQLPVEDLGSGECMLGEVEVVNWFGASIDEINHARELRNSNKQILKLQTSQNINIFSEESQGKSVCFYGAGIFAQAFTDQFDLSGINIQGFFDKSKDKNGLKLANHPIYLPEKIRELKPDRLVLTMAKSDRVLPYIIELRKKYNLCFEIFDSSFNKID